MFALAVASWLAAVWSLTIRPITVGAMGMLTIITTGAMAMVALATLGTHLLFLFVG